MATNVILPALGMSQDTGKIVHWLKAEGEQVTKREPLLEIETDKATVEVEAPASGLLARVSATAGEDVPVGQVIAVVLAADEAVSEAAIRQSEPGQSHVVQQQSAPPSLEIPHAENSVPADLGMPGVHSGVGLNGASSAGARPSTVAATLLASRIPAPHHIDLGQVQPAGQRIQKADVLAYLQHQQSAGGRLLAASPKARRLAREQRKDLAA